MDIKPDEVQCTPNDITAETLRKRCANVEEMAAELHDKMRRELAHSRVSRCWQEAAKQTFIANTVS